MYGLVQFKQKPSIYVGSSSFSDLVYADDTAFFVKDAADATDCLSSFNYSSSVFGLHTSWPKTKLQSTGACSGPDLLNIVVDGNPVDLVESFTYLSSVQTSDGYCRSDITRQISLASSAMSSFSNIWSTKQLSVHTKVRVYQTLVLSILLNASETWTLRAHSQWIKEMNTGTTSNSACACVQYCLFSPNKEC